MEVARHQNWMIYSLPRKRSAELDANLACLQDCAQEDPVFRKDVERLGQRAGKFSENSPICCSAKSKKTTTCQTA